MPFQTSLTSKSVPESAASADSQKSPKKSAVLELLSRVYCFLAHNLRSRSAACCACRASMVRERRVSSGGSLGRRSSVTPRPYADGGMLGRSASRDEGLIESSTSALHDDLSSATRTGVTGMERTPEPLVSRRLSVSEKTPTRSFYHRSFHGSLGEILLSFFSRRSFISNFF